MSRTRCTTTLEETRKASLAHLALLPNPNMPKLKRHWVQVWRSIRESVRVGKQAYCNQATGTHVVYCIQRDYSRGTDIGVTYTFSPEQPVLVRTHGPRNLKQLQAIASSFIKA